MVDSFLRLSICVTHHIQVLPWINILAERLKCDTYGYLQRLMRLNGKIINDDILDSP